LASLCFAFRRVVFEGEDTEPLDVDDYTIGAFLERNATFTAMKSRILAFRLSSQFCEVYVPAEVWDVLSFEFVLPLCFVSNK
jgi:hypothetical protein